MRHRAFTRIERKLAVMIEEAEKHGRWNLKQNLEELRALNKILAEAKEENDDEPIRINWQSDS